MCVCQCQGNLSVCGLACIHEYVQVFVWISQSTVFFLLMCGTAYECVWVGACGNCSLEFAYLVCIRACWWSQCISGLSEEVLTSVMLCQSSDQTGAQRQIKTQADTSGLLAWIDAHTNTQNCTRTTILRQILTTVPHPAHIHVIVKEGGEGERGTGWGSTRVQPPPPWFQCLKPFHLMNVPKKMTVLL